MRDQDEATDPTRTTRYPRRQRRSYGDDRDRTLSSVDRDEAMEEVETENSRTVPYRHV